MLAIRLLERQDFTQGFLETLGNLAPISLGLEEAIAIWNARSLAGIRTAVAMLNDRVVGTASLLIERKFIHNGGVVGHIEDVAVHAEHGGKGIGRAILEHLIGLAKETGCYKVILSCHEPLMPFYAKLGFRRHDNGMRIDLKT